jgi:hypothetical protein
MDVNESVGNTVSYNPNVDALEEINISAGNGPAEFGNANQWRGNVFEFLRRAPGTSNSA